MGCSTFLRRAKNIRNAASGTLIAVTSAIARAISAANVYQSIKPPRNQCGQANDPVRNGFRQVTLSAAQQREILFPIL
jgi:hypothetical protein